MTIDVPWLRSDAPALGAFEDRSVLGNGKAARIEYDGTTQQYSLGADRTADQYSGILWKRMEGDFILHGRVDAVNTTAGLSYGLMVRSSLESDAVVVSVVHDGTQVRLRSSASRQGDTAVNISGDVLQLERTGSIFGMKVARFGEPFSAAVTTEAFFDGAVYVGLFVDGVANTAADVRFSNVRLVIPADEETNTRERPLGSLLEILDLASGKRQIIYSSTTPFEAPNWTPDGQALIYNSQGRLYRFDLGTGSTNIIDTGFAIRNNNDHVLSFDGTMLGISDHTEEGHSLVYVVPVAGGTPRRLTEHGPSYLHGWSPDGRYVVYTGARNGEYDIYRISTDGGEETQLTTAVGLDDGSEYTPDGRYIYFNSVRSGAMQIWRMAADGSAQEQMTDDEYNNWFPHVSPDGTQLVFLSYASDVPANAHPPYKHVYLRTMPVDGGEPAVVAYLYGGQGTINVPSWSPDGTHFAFVSNTA